MCKSDVSLEKCFTGETEMTDCDPSTSMCVALYRGNPRSRDWQPENVYFLECDNSLYYYKEYCTELQLADGEVCKVASCEISGCMPDLGQIRRDHGFSNARINRLVVKGTQHLLL